VGVWACRRVGVSAGLETLRWRAIDEPQEADFRLTAVSDGKRYELYSDGSFADVEN
jgi:hypothetical protein